MYTMPEIFKFILQILLFLYQIVYDVIIVQDTAIFAGFKTYYTKRIARVMFRDLFFRKVHGRVGKYLLLQYGDSIKKCVNFSSYDYLGVNEWPIPNNTEIDISDANNKLKRALTQFLGYQSVFLSSTGYSTNAVYLRTIIGDGLVISDSKNHNSSIIGCKGLRKIIFKHNDMTELESILMKHKQNDNLFVMIEGLYSMCGHTSNIKEIVKLQEKYKFKLIVDEAHSFGSLGDNGKGSFDVDDLDILAHVDVYIATFSKTFNGSGGFVATNNEIIANALNKCETETIQSATCVHIVNIIKHIMSDSGKMDIRNLKEMSVYLHNKLAENKLKLYSDIDSPVKCLDLGYSYEGADFIRYALKHNLALTCVGYPATEMLRFTLRICLSTCHTMDDLDYLISVIQRRPITKPFDDIVDHKKEIKTFDSFPTTQSVIEHYGIGTSGPPAFYGSLSVTREIEDRIAKKYNKGASIILSHDVCGMDSIYAYLKKHDSHGALVDITEYVKYNKPINPIILERNKYIVCNLTKLERPNVQGILFLSDYKTIDESVLNINQYIFSASLPMYIYYNIGKLFLYG